MSLARRRQPQCPRPTCGGRMAGERAYGAAPGHERVKLICLDVDCDAVVYVDVTLATGGVTVVEAPDLTRQSGLDRDLSSMQGGRRPLCLVPGCHARAMEAGLCHRHLIAWQRSQEQQGRHTSVQHWLAGQETKRAS